MTFRVVGNRKLCRLLTSYRHFTHWPEASGSLLLSGIPLATVLVLQMCIKLPQHVFLEVLNVKQHIERLSTSRAFRFMKRPGRRIVDAQICFWHVAMISRDPAWLRLRKRK